MRLFVAIESLGEEGDFSHTVPGELVYVPPVTCDCPDCGCDRAMAGFVSQRATTCFVAREIDIDAATYGELFLDSLAKAGWIQGTKESREWAKANLEEHIEAAAGFPTETPLAIEPGGIGVRDRRLNA